MPISSDLPRDDQRAEAAELPELMLPLLQALGIFQGKDAVLGDHVEQGDVDGVHAFAEDAPLPALLPAVGEELAGVLEVVALDDFAQGLRRFELFAAAGEDIADLALLDRDQGELVNGILPAPEAEVQAAAEDVGLVAGLAVQGDDRAFRQRTGGSTRVFPRCRCGRWGYSAWSTRPTEEQSTAECTIDEPAIRKVG